MKEFERPRIRILVAEDHPVVSDGIVAILSKAKDMVVVGQARDGAGAIEMLRQLQPDIVLLDLRMPVVDGLGVLRWLKNSSSNVGTVILSAFCSANDVDQALRTGANAFVFKDVSAAGLLKIIRRVHQSRFHNSNNKAVKLAPNLKSSDFNTSELDILALIVQGCDNRTIGLQVGLATNTVKYVLRGLFSKLGVRKRAAAARQAIERGLIKGE